MKTALYLHGLASSARSNKARFLQQKLAAYPGIRFDALDFHPTPADFYHMTITGMVNRLRQHLLANPPGGLVLVGSSLGGLVALQYARCFGEVEGLLLLAPALHFRRSDPEMRLESVYHYAFQRELPLGSSFYDDGAFYSADILPPLPLTILHGIQDDVIPIEESRRYAHRYPEHVRLLEIDGDHQLSQNFPFIWEQLYQLLGLGD
jgi:uncharacterized protein